ncbi:MAG: hypothetical protein MUC88_20440 [Planctomycetes bacterium]|jgi:hypothetical protein|nr:hypothetical protein [Planctomycetota bacterium]
MIFFAESTMGVQPTIREFENRYARMWWRGWLVGMLTGVAVSMIVVFVSMWVGALWT